MLEYVTMDEFNDNFDYICLIYSFKYILLCNYLKDNES